MSTKQARPPVRQGDAAAGAFWARVTQSDGCWMWQGPLDRLGYGREGRRRVIAATGNCLAHRIAYVLIFGPIPPGMVLDHLCRNPRCVNPAHLEAVTQAENVQRGLAGEVNGRRMREKRYCKHGHEFTPENTYVYPNGDRECRTCARAAKAKPEYRARERARRAARIKEAA